MMQRVKRRCSLVWLFEPLEGDPRFLQRKFFSFEAAYLDGRLYLAVSCGKKPWNGLLVCTSREYHRSLRDEFSPLASHKVLAKWLYLSQAHPQFESVAQELVELARKRDARLGVETQARARPTRRKTS